MEEEKTRQSRIIDELFGTSSEDKTCTSSQEFLYKEPLLLEQKEEEKTAGLDLKSLFSGEQFKFLGIEGEETSKKRNLLTSGKQEKTSTSQTVGDPKKIQKNFFFHWTTPNRLDCSFHSNKDKEEIERLWPEQRSTMKRFLRQSHRHALRTTRKNRRFHNTLS